MIESGLQAKVLKYLNHVPQCIAENVSGNAQQSGRSDISGCYKGRCFKIELKSPDTGHTLSKQQELYLRRWKQAGSLVGVCYSIEDVKEVLSIE